MPIEERDSGIRSLAMLQAAILSARAMLEMGEDLEQFYDESVDDIADAMAGLDHYLTGKAENRRGDADRTAIRDLFFGKLHWLVQLSDGGYSRLKCNMEEGHPVRIDKELSREPVLKKWAALFPPS